MIDKRTEASVNYAEILAKGMKSEQAQVSEPAAAAVSWNAPSMNMAAAMASLMMGSSAQEAAAPVLSSNTLREATEFAEAKSQLKNMLDEAERVVAGMQPGPEKTHAQGVMASARSAGANDIRGVLEALKAMLDAAKGKEIAVEGMIDQRAQSEAEREIRLRQLRDQSRELMDDLVDQRFGDKKQQEKIEALQDDIEKRQARIKELEQLGDKRNADQNAEYKALLKEQSQDLRQTGNEIREFADTAEANAQEAGKPTPHAVEGLRAQADEYNSQSHAFDKQAFEQKSTPALEHSEASLAENLATPAVPNVKAAKEAAQQTQNTPGSLNTSSAPATEKTVITQANVSDDMFAEFAAAPVTPIATPTAPAKDASNSVG